jgi:AraC-like DNA-binding protein
VDPRERLNERAAPDAISCIGGGKTLYVGSLGHVDWHRHGAPVFIAGLTGNLRLGMPNGEWLTCRAAVIPAGVSHALDLEGDPLAVFYPEPGIAGFSDLARLGRAWNTHGRVLVGQQPELKVFRELYENRRGLDFAAEALDALVDFMRSGGALVALDPRIARVVAGLDAHPDDLTPLATVAAAAGLSASRFQHLFTREIGVPFRHFRIWNRLRAALRLHLAGHSLTAAALAAGFADSAHFSRLYRRTWGATPSCIHRQVARGCAIASPAAMHGAGGDAAPLQAIERFPITLNRETL